VRITNSTFINCSVSETKSQGGVIYCEIKKDGRLIIGDEDNNNINENVNKNIIENKFENCSTLANENSDCRGGAIALHLEDSCTSDSIHFIGVKTLFYF
jgi:hypothetical protein